MQTQDSLQSSWQQHQQPCQRVEQVASPRTHTCISCQVPIAVHGRLIPCKHAFCLECATQMPKCVICCANIQVIERVSQPLYISSLSQRAFLSEDQLQTDTRQAVRRLMTVPALAEAYQQYRIKLEQQNRSPGQGVQQQQRAVPARLQQPQSASLNQQQQQQQQLQQQQST